jgi:NDP-sugar pyrophosphorylase family protein
MVSVGGRPFLEHQLEYLRAQGIRRVVVCAGHLGDQIQAHFGDGSRWGIRIDYSFDGPAQLGTAGAIKQALPLLGKTFFVLYGDSWLPTRFDAVLDAFHASGAPAMMTVFHNRNRWDRSNVWFEAGRILAYDKHNWLPQMEHIDYGLSVLRPAASGLVFPSRARKEAVLIDPGAAMIFSRAVLPAGFEVHERFYEIGSPTGLEEFRRDFC